MSALQDMRGVKAVDGTQGACHRCEAGVGGYQLRWHSSFWAQPYNKMKTEGTWAAPEPAPDKRLLNQDLRK